MAIRKAFYQLSHSVNSLPCFLLPEDFPLSKFCLCSYLPNLQKPRVSWKCFVNFPWKEKLHCLYQPRCNFAILLQRKLSCHHPRLCVQHFCLSLKSFVTVDESHQFTHTLSLSRCIYKPWKGKLLKCSFLGPWIIFFSNCQQQPFFLKGKPNTQI